MVKSITSCVCGNLELRQWADVIPVTKVTRDTQDYNVTYTIRCEQCSHTVTRSDISDRGSLVDDLVRLRGEAEKLWNESGRDVCVDRGDLIKLIDYCITDEARDYEANCLPEYWTLAEDGEKVTRLILSGELNSGHVYEVLVRLSDRLAQD